MIGVSLIEHDPDLFAELDDDAMDDAQEAIVPAWQIEKGPWAPPPIASERALFGLLLLDGFLSRETILPDGRSIEVLGPGDVLRPWTTLADTGLDVEVEWEALETSAMAALDGRFGSVALRHPVIMATLMDRYVARTIWATRQLAVGHIVGLDKRLETMLWHLAERWGRVNHHGVVLPLRLSHEFLAKLMGVRRPSVTSAISRLRSNGVLERRPDGTWLLHGDPPEGLIPYRDRVLSASL